MERISHPAINVSADADDVDLPDWLAAVEETTSAYDTLAEVDRLLKPHGLRVVIVEPTERVDVVCWGFKIEEAKR